MSVDIGINSALDGGGHPLGSTAYVAQTPLTPYKVYTGTISSGTVVMDALDDLSPNDRRQARGGLIDNFGPGDFYLAASADGTNYGDNYKLKAGLSLSLDYFIVYKKLKLTFISSSATYQALVI